MFRPKSTKRHIYRSRAFHWYQNQLSGPPRFRDIARTNSSVKKKRFLANFGQFDHDRLAESGQKYQKAHLQFESFPLVQKSIVWASSFSRDRPYKQAMTDGQTDGRTPQTYRPQSEGLGPKNLRCTPSLYDLSICNSRTKSVQRIPRNSAY